MLAVWPLRPCQAVQAHAQSIEKAEGLHRSGHARSPPTSAGYSRRQPEGSHPWKARLGVATVASGTQGANKIYALHEPEVD